MKLDTRILFIDGEAMILDKPAGLAVTRPKQGGISLENYLASLTFGFKRWPEPVHRLDRDTSGCLLLARNPKSLLRFQRAFEERRVVKEYLAVLDGVPESTQGDIDLPLHKISSREQGWRMVADDRGKKAQTHWEIVTVKDGRALIRFKPETGRTHQIRAHALYGIGIPIVGDPIYGTAEKTSLPMLLHSSFLSVARDNKSPVEARAPLPQRFHAAGFDDPDTAPISETDTLAASPYVDPTIRQIPEDTGSPS